jgi:hypothetical protein
MPKTSRGGARPPKARTSGQWADPAETTSRPQETGKTVDLATDTVEPGPRLSGSAGIPLERHLSGGRRGSRFRGRAGGRAVGDASG